MSRKLQFKRGVKAKLPVLAEGEPGWVTDEERLYIGTGSKNIPLATDGTLSTQSDNYRDAAALPSTYPRGVTVFFSNSPTSKFNGVSFCTVFTIKGYTNMACVQYIYPYNVDAPITYRYALYNSDTWGAWRKLSIEGHTHSAASVGAVPTTRKVNGKALSADVSLTAADVGARPSTWVPTKGDVGLGNVPNVTTDDQTPTFTVATTRANLTSGDKLSVILGKLAKWYTDLKGVAFSGSAADLSTGTLASARLPTVPISKGGTGATTAAAARTALGLGKALTFTGAATGTYDGTAAKTINIPASNGKRACRFVVGTTTAGWTAEDCDYLCDGTDDQVEIKAAIQALPSTGGEVVFLDGTYIFSDYIIVSNKSSITICGNGRAACLKVISETALSKSPIYFLNSTDITIQNITIDGNNVADYGIECGVCNRIVVSQCKIINTNYAVYTGGEGCIITQNTILNAKTGVATGKNSVICGNILWNKTGDTHYSEIKSKGINVYSENCAIFGNKITGFQYGICAGTAGDYCSITGNVCKDNEIGFYGEMGSSCIVSGNVFMRGEGTASDYTASQYTIFLTSSKYILNNVFIGNIILGKNYVNNAGASNTFINNRFE